MPQLLFLNWDRPVLESAAEFLVKKYRNGNKLDLSNVILCLPGTRAGRRIEELLLSEIEKQGIDPDWFPPEVVTFGRLPEMLYELKRPLADEIVLRFAWLGAIDRLREESPDVLDKFLSRPPEPHEIEERLAISRLFSSLHKELASDTLNFKQVADKCREKGLVQETTRWDALAELQNIYLSILDDLKLWDVQTARIYAINEKEPKTEKEIVLIGTVDMNRTQKSFIDLVADKVTPLVFAPESMSEYFDAHGCLQIKKWTTLPIALDDSMLEVCDRPSDEASGVIRFLSELGGEFSANRIAIGVPNEEIVPYLEQRFRQCGLRSRLLAGTSMRPTPVYRFLESLAELIQTRLYSAFAALLRHPDFQGFLAGTLADEFSGDWITIADRYHETYLPGTLDDIRERPPKEGEPVFHDFSVLEKIVTEIRSLFGDLWDNSRRFPGEWGNIVREIIEKIFGNSQLPLDLASIRALDAIIERFCEIPELLAPSILPYEAIRLILSELDSQRIVPPQEFEAIELLGWLDLPMDDAPAMIITGLNEGVVPSSKSADLFLPNEIRTSLGIEDNDRRFARDAYAISLILATHPDKSKLRFSLRRRTSEGDPLLPTRLFFATDPETIAHRLIRFFETKIEDDAVNEAFHGDIQPGAKRNTFAIPHPQPLEKEVTSMRVTEFRDYLACPYRYYLRHRLRLDISSDDSREMDARVFGNLAHEVLSRFARSDVRDLTLIEPIRDWLNRTLDEILESEFGKSPLPVIEIQFEQLRHRLDAFARWQAEWAALGNRIRYDEFAPQNPKSAFIEVDGKKMFLRGRIDRIDFNSRTGGWTIFDYKTSESGMPPDKTHRKKDAWVDLQLPLYRHIVRGSIPEMDSPPQLGYIVLPKDIRKIGAEIAEWTPDDLAGADEAARSVIRGIRAEKFWPPSDPRPAFSEIYAPICLDDQFKLD